MNILDFKTIFAIICSFINAHIKESLYGDMFSSYGASKNKVEALNKYKFSTIMSGQKVPTTQMIAYYNNDEQTDELTEDLKLNILPYIAQKFELCKRIKECIQVSVPNENDRELLLQYYPTKEDEIPVFLTKVIIFALNNKDVSSAGSPDISDMINIPKIKPCKNFSGRKKELEALHEMLQAHDKIFVYGIGGIGKSEFVKQYAQDNTEAYKNILFITYTGSLKAAVANINFINEHEKNTEALYAAHMEYLRLLKGDTLLIIDNFDIYPDDDADFQDIYDLDCKIIFTTRCHISDDYSQFELTEMSVDEIMLIAAAMKVNEPADMLYRLFTTVHCHTLCCDLIIRLLLRGGMSSQNILDNLANEPAAPDISDRIRKSSDNLTYTNHVRKLFALWKLTDEQQTVLRYMCIIPEDGLGSLYFTEITSLQDMNAVNELDEMGLITFSDYTIRVHQMIAEVICSQLSPDMENMAPVVDGLIYQAIHIGDNIINRINCLIIVVLTGNFIRMVNKTDTDRYVYFLNIVCNFCENVEFTDAMRMILNEISFYVDGIADQSQKAVYYMSKAALSNNDNDKKAALAYLRKAESMLPDTADTAAAHNLVFNVNNNLLYLYTDMGDLGRAHKYFNSTSSILNTYDDIEIVSRIAYHFNAVKMYEKEKNYIKASVEASHLVPLCNMIPDTFKLLTALATAIEMFSKAGKPGTAQIYMGQYNSIMRRLLLPSKGTGDTQANFIKALE